jgi:hypothetical protein
MEGLAGVAQQLCPPWPDGPAAAHPRQPSRPRRAVTGGQEGGHVRENLHRGQPWLRAPQVGARGVQRHLPAASGQVCGDVGQLTPPAVIPAPQPADIDDQQVRVGGESASQ